VSVEHFSQSRNIGNLRNRISGIDGIAQRATSGRLGAARNSSTN
jgi:hypothetical protein